MPRRLLGVDQSHRGAVGTGGAVRRVVQLEGDPVTDGWLALISDNSGGTDMVVNPHNGQASQTIVDVLGVAPTALHEGIDYLTTKIA